MLDWNELLIIGAAALIFIGPKELPGALRTMGKFVAKARGMSQLAKDTGLGRESLYKALAPGAKPRYDTIIKLVRALGVELRTAPVHGGGS